VLRKGSHIIKTLDIRTVIGVMTIYTWASIAVCFTKIDMETQL